ncbi:TetR/AcrR family transcriptional regulator [Tsukamurella sp. 8F]|uniref:TetR/AcrR family transcriptional regulator n=1 Tax=unclassified Tsukamurella TaxID=2633480 RepID=UPI0023BA04F9|nr:MULTISPECIES: TetR/AcrR family transcriptional regulator [unclassified Tsukamurella]MDF0529758.1 TetR/AcrR family transcriptional regulator [Tsukamurella sp. 8J]MDF0586043.1 TetR/AcrR family transcriptional regulator [Tsukamurella sp. 8F]
MESAEIVDVDANEPARPGRRRTLDKRRSILDAAAPVFGESGYQRASIDSIANAAGVSKPTIYSYFGGKEELFRESVADSARNLNADSVAAVRELEIAAESWRESLFRVALALTACQRSECAAALSRLVNAEVLRDPTVFTVVRDAGYRPIVEALAGRLAMVSNAGFLDIADPVLAAKQFLALTQAELADLTLLATREVPDEDVRRAVAAGVDTFVRAHRPV